MSENVRESSGVQYFWRSVGMCGTITSYGRGRTSRYGRSVYKMVGRYRKGDRVETDREDVHHVRSFFCTTTRMARVQARAQRVVLRSLRTIA